MKMIDVSQDNFRKEVLESEKPALIEFWASWCEGCEVLAPLLEEIANERPDIKVCRIDADANIELSGAFRIKSLPTLSVMQDGKVIRSTIGVQCKSTILNMLSKITK